MFQSASLINPDSSFSMPRKCLHWCKLLVNVALNMGLLALCYSIIIFVFQHALAYAMRSSEVFTNHRPMATSAPLTRFRRFLLCWRKILTPFNHLTHTQSRITHRRRPTVLPVMSQVDCALLNFAEDFKAAFEFCACAVGAKTSHIHHSPLLLLIKGTREKRLV